MIWGSQVGWIPANFNSANQSAFGTLETGELTPIFQWDFVYGLNKQLWNYNYTFVITAPSVSPTVWAIYTNNNGTFICIWSASTTAVFSGSSDPAASWTLTKVSGTGDATLTFSSFTYTVWVTNWTGATIDTNAGRLRIQSGTSSTGYAYITGKKIIRYRAGQGTMWRYTPLFTAWVANNIQLHWVGSIQSNAAYNGYFFGFNWTAFWIAHYIAWTPTWTAQTAWNGDRCDWTSWTSFNRNPVNGSPVMIKYPYLWYWDIFFYVQKPIDWSWILVHTIRYANTTTTVELTNPSLQFISGTWNSGNTTNQTMYTASVWLFISGTRSFISNPKKAMDSYKSAITAETNILSIRNADFYNGMNNRGMIRMNSLTISSSANQTAIIRLKMWVTLWWTPAYTAINGTTTDNGVTITNWQSIASYDTAGTTIAGWDYQFNIWLYAESVQIDLTPYEILIAPGEVLTISWFGAGSTIIWVSANWSEDI